MIDSLKHQNKSLSNEIEIFTYNFSNESYEGSISLAYLKDLSFSTIGYLINDNTFDFRSFTNNNFNRYNYHKSLLTICQKGVLINKGNDFSILSDIFCNLNLKQKIDIQISRNNFSNELEMSKIIYDITSELLLAFFEKLNNDYKPEELSKITYRFINGNNLNFKKSIYSKLFFSLNDENNKYTFINFEDFLKKDVKSFIISLNKKNTIYLNTKLKNQLIIEFYSNNFNNRERQVYSNIAFFKKNKYNEILIKKDDFHYLELTKEKSKPEIMSFLKPMVSFILTKNINQIIIDELHVLNLFDSDYEFVSNDYSVNINHPFVQEVFAYKETDLNQKTKQLIIEIFRFIANIEDNDSMSEALNTLDILQKELKNNISIKYELSKNDFPFEI